MRKEYGLSKFKVRRNPYMEKSKQNVIVVIGAGSIGQAIARRVSVGKHIVLADLRQDNADAAAKLLSDAGFSVSTEKVDVSSRASVQALAKTAISFGEIFGVIHAAGVSPSQASPETILKVDLYGTALVLEEFGNVIAAGGSCVVISSQSGHRLPPLTVEQNNLLATTSVEELFKLPIANDELNGPRGAGYRRMIELCAAAGTPDEVGVVGALLMGPDGTFITGSDFLMDGGVTASYWFGGLAPK